MTIQRVRVADCDRSTDESGKFTSPAYNWVVMEDVCNNVDEGVWFESESEAEEYAASLQ